MVAATKVIVTMSTASDEPTGYAVAAVEIDYAGNGTLDQMIAAAKEWIASADWTIRNLTTPEVAKLATRGIGQVAAQTFFERMEGGEGRSEPGE